MSIAYGWNGSRTAKAVKRIFMLNSRAKFQQEIKGDPQPLGGTVGILKVRKASRATPQISSILAEIKIISTLFGFEKLIKQNSTILPQSPGSDRYPSMSHSLCKDLGQFAGGLYQPKWPQGDKP